MIGLGSNRLTVCRRGGMSVTQAGRGGMEWLAGGRVPSLASPYSAQATAALLAQFPTQWPTIKLYGQQHPEIVPYVNANPTMYGYIIAYHKANLDTYFATYQGCEFVQASGSQRFEIDLNGNSGTTRLDHIIQFTNLTSRQLMGQNGGGGYWGVNSSGNYERYTDSGVRAGGKDEVVIDSSLPHMTVNGVETNLSSSTGWSGTAKYQLFQLGGSYSCRAKLWYFSAWKNGTAQCIGFPYYNKTSGTIGMYDVVTGTFYTNKGSGTFSKGSDVYLPTISESPAS